MSEENKSLGIVKAERTKRGKQNRSHYKMTHPRRGIAAIFNHRFFNNTFCERVGSEKDVEKLHHTFTRLGFDVEEYHDFSFDEVTSTLECLGKEDHSNCDCFVLVYMSHGLQGRLRSFDKEFPCSHVWEAFTPQKAPSLEGKPKIIIIQACQGVHKQGGVKVAEASDYVKGCTLVPGYALNCPPDFLIAMSTVPGFVSWRSVQEGAWYIQALCQHLDQFGFKQDLVTILTHVGRKISIDFSAIDFQDLDGEPIKKQLPFVISYLVKKVQFTRKRQQVRTKNQERENNGNYADDRGNIDRPD